ncbi:hypothetical protein ABFS83_09G103300 [Erythranthe nasuta]
MSVPQEHDYIGLPMEKASDKILSPSSSSTISSGFEKNEVLNLKRTELRLGLPGSESPERKAGFGVSLFGKDESNSGFSQNFVSGSKRGFNDVINCSGNWGLCINGGSEVVDCKVEIPTVNILDEKKKNQPGNTAPASKAQVVGWPPVRSFRKNTLATNLPKNNEAAKQGPNCLYVKVSMDGAPYLRKIDLKTCSTYPEISSALAKMFSCFTIGQYGQGLAGKEGLSESGLMDLIHGSEYVLTYEDKDGDWMLVGDVPWGMFIDSCKRLRIMKGSDAIGLAPRTMQKFKNQN